MNIIFDGARALCVGKQPLGLVAFGEDFGTVAEEQIANKSVLSSTRELSHAVELAEDVFQSDVQRRRRGSSGFLVGAQELDSF
jgi:hypothetical protein